MTEVANTIESQSSSLSSKLQKKIADLQQQFPDAGAFIDKVQNSLSPKLPHKEKEFEINAGLQLFKQIKKLPENQQKLGNLLLEKLTIDSISGTVPYNLSIWNNKIKYGNGNNFITEFLLNISKLGKIESFNSILSSKPPDNTRIGKLKSLIEMYYQKPDRCGQSIHTPLYSTTPDLSQEVDENQRKEIDEKGIETAQEQVSQTFASQSAALTNHPELADKVKSADELQTLPESEQLIIAQNLGVANNPKELQAFKKEVETSQYGQGGLSFGQLLSFLQTEQTLVSGGIESEFTSDQNSHISTKQIQFFNLKIVIKFSIFTKK